MNPLMDALEKMLGNSRLNRIADTLVGIGGLGGLGSNVAMHLVRSGFTSFVLADFDRVEASNLNRQFYFPDQLGVTKAEALAENLLRINPDLKLRVFSGRVTTDNIESLFEECEIWVEAFDEAVMKKMYVEKALRLNKKVISASGLAGWGNTDAMQTKIWSSGLAVVGDLHTAVGIEAPPLSPRVGVAAAKEADLVLTWVLGEEESGKND